MGWYDQAKEDRSLAHHGIKGQKWGVRRFQDYSGKRIGAGASKGKSKKSKHDFTDYSKSQSERGEVYGMLALSAASTVALTALNSATFSVGYINGRAALANVISAVGTVAYSGIAVSREVNNVVANSKEKKFAKERAQNPVDKKTGFHKKTQEMSPEEDMERVNPGYKNWDTNTKNNCALCTMSYELRRRGFDVQANKATQGYDIDTLVKDYYKGAKPKESKGSLSESEILSEYYNGTAARIPKDRQKQMIDSTVAEIEKQKDGARGMMTCVWNGTASGHAFNYANEGGKLVIYDTQANKRYEGDKATKYLENCSQLTVTRLDNCKLDTKYIKEVAS